MTLLGQHDGLMTQPDPFLREGFGQSLKFFEDCDGSGQTSIKLLV